jgi:hypothetical protein
MSQTLGRQPLRAAAAAALFACITTGAHAMGGAPSTTSNGGFTQTRYPIVLAHGLFGVGSIGPVPESVTLGASSKPRPVQEVTAILHIARTKLAASALNN